jgi:CRP/FNR family transcriptional regulator, cyclic AMP receptor protein
MDALPVFDRNPWFAALPREARHDLWARVRPHRLAHGATLFSRGQAATGFFGIAEGALNVAGHSAEGKRITLTLLEPGNWIGEVSLIDGGGHTHDVLAHGETLLVWLPPAGGAEWLAAHPTLHAHFARLLCQRARATYAWVEALTALPKPALIAHRLMTLAEAFGERSAGSTQLTVRLSQEDIATLVGVSRQRVNQEVQRLAALGILDAAYGDIRVHDLDALRREATPSG